MFKVHEALRKLKYLALAGNVNAVRSYFCAYVGGALVEFIREPPMLSNRGFRVAELSHGSCTEY